VGGALGRLRKTALADRVVVCRFWETERYNMVGERVDKDKLSGEEKEISMSDVYKKVIPSVFIVLRSIRYPCVYTHIFTQLKPHTLQSYPCCFCYLSPKSNSVFCIKIVYVYVRKGRQNKSRLARLADYVVIVQWHDKVIELKNWVSASVPVKAIIRVADVRVYLVKMGFMCDEATIYMVKINTRQCLGR
jgi:hypothetical protein